MFSKPWSLFVTVALTAGIPHFAHAATGIELEGYRTLSRYTISGLEKAAMDEIAVKYSIAARHGDQYEVYVHVDEADAFRKLAPGAKLEEYDVDAWMHSDNLEYATGYESYGEIQDMFDMIEQEHPEFFKNMNYDFMVDESGGPILVGKFSKNPDKENPKKTSVVITGCTHGDEWIATAVVLGIIDKLVEGYGTDDRITKMIDWTEIYFVPVVSPTSYHISREVGGADPNRVYPYPGNDSQPSMKHAQSMMKLYENLKPTASLDYHGVQGSVMYPWGYSCKGFEDQEIVNWYDQVAGDMAAAAGYIHGDICNTIYQAAGGTVDAWEYLHGTRSLVIEVGASSKRPSESEIPGHVAKNAEATFILIEAIMPEVDPGDDDDDTTTSDETTSQDTSEDTGEDTTSQQDSSSDEDTQDSTTADDSEKSSDDSSTSADSKGQDSSNSGDASTGDNASNSANDSGSDDNGATTQNSGCAVAPSTPAALWSGFGLLALGWGARRRNRRS